MINAFVLLAHGFGAESWNKKWSSGSLIGLNEPYAYGYKHAESEALQVRYSEDLDEGVFKKYTRLLARAATGFDLVHAWRHRAQIFAADVVWTHTESQSLAVGALIRLFPKRPRPKLILQSVWLMDRWDQLSAPRQALYRYLLKPADILSFHSPLNTQKAKHVFPKSRCEFVCFAIRADMTKPPHAPESGAVLQILSPGSDRHRDWGTLIAAVKNRPEYAVTIVSGTCPPNLIEGADNIRICQPNDNAMLSKLYDEASVVVVPLVENLHASGCTVVEEATQMGCAVIVSDVGGLRAYFDENCLTYVPSRDAEALRSALKTLYENPDAALTKIVNAQARMKGDEGLNSRSYALQHARWSHELLDPPSPTR